MTCRFCEYLADLQTIDRVRERGNPMLHHDYHVLLFQRAWNDFTGTAHAGTMTHRPGVVGFEINYCPECGRRIENGDKTK